MICSNCKSKFNTPLYLYDGATTCPVCKSELLAISNLEITKRSQELYQLSAIAFKRYLSPVSCQNGGGAIKLNKKALFNLAYGNCQKSAKLGHPQAIFQMAYFSEYFDVDNKSQIERVRQAFEYYSALCYSEISFVKTEKGAKGLTEEEFLELKVSAGKNLLRIATTYKNLLKSSVHYDYAKNKARLSKLYSNSALDQVTTANSFDKVSAVLNTLVASRSKTKAPLFGLFVLTGSQLKELASKKNESGQFILPKLVHKDPNFLRFMLCDQYGRVRRGEEEYFDRIANVERLEKLIADVGEEDHVLLYFFNAYGKHQYLSGRQIQTVKRELEEDSQTLLIKISHIISEDIVVFYDDDIKQFAKGKLVYGAVSQLQDHIRGEN